jgi:glycerol kinase
VHWLLIDEYIAFKLCGERGSEPSQASRTMLMNLHDLTWDQEILDKVEIDERMLPPLVASGTRLGPVTARASADTGLPHVKGASGEHVAGTYCQRLTLASGRFAMIDNGLGFQLVPWSRELEKRLGQHVTGVVKDGGGIEWGLGRKRDLGL